MWTTEISGESTAVPDRVWALQCDVTTWPDWNGGVRRVELSGPFAAGTGAVMVFPDDSSLPFTITAVEPGRLYEDLTDVPDAGVSVRVRHELEPCAGGTRITYHCEVTGADDDTCAAVGAEISADFADVIAGLARAAESAVPSPEAG